MNPDESKEEYRMLGESGLYEDEEGNVYSASELFPRDKDPEEERKMAEWKKRFRKSTFVGSLDDKSNPAYWYYYYDPRYCGPSREEYMQEMARQHAGASPHSEKADSTPAKKPQGLVSPEARRKADSEQRETERLGLHSSPTDNVNGRVYFRIVDRQGQVVIGNDKYSVICNFSNGLALVLKKNRLFDFTKRFGFIDRHGNEVVGCVWRQAEHFHDYFAAVCNQAGKWGFVDVTGRMAIPCEWTRAWSFQGGMARVADDNGRIGAIDENGKLAVPCQWKSMGEFVDGKAAVEDYNGQKGFVSNKGEFTPAP